jgi:hypothetical protein
MDWARFVALIFLFAGGNLCFPASISKPLSARVAQFPKALDVFLGPRFDAAQGNRGKLWICLREGEGSR